MNLKQQRFEDFKFATIHPSKVLRNLLESEHYIFAPGLFSAGGMKMAAHVGFMAGYFSGFSYAVEEHGVTDVGAFSRVEMADQAKRMVRAAKYYTREKYIETGSCPVELPLIMDLEDGHGGFGQVQMFMQHVLPGGIAAGHLEDQAERRCGHLPGKILVSVQKQKERLLAARSEADQMGYDDFVLIARTDACTSRYPTPGSVGLAIERTLEYSRMDLHNRQVIDMAWCEFPNQDFEVMKYWAKAIRKEHPKLPLAVNLSSSFDWTNSKYRHFTFEALADLGFKYQFMTLADYHASRLGAWKFFRDIKILGTNAFSKLQNSEKIWETPSISHNVMAGTDTYFVGGTSFGSESFQSKDIKETDAELSET